VVIDINLNHIYICINTSRGHPIREDEIENYVKKKKKKKKKIEYE
jgi:hypothetical protein